MEQKIAADISRGSVAMQSHKKWRI